MKTTPANEWMLLTYFMLFGIFTLSFFHFIFFSIVSTADDVHYTFKNVFPYGGEVMPVFAYESETDVAEAVNENDGGIEPADTVMMMALNRTSDIGGAAIVYRGLEGGGEFRVDVMIPELDPDVFYSYRFNIGEAKNGFRLAERRFKLLSARKTYLHLKAVHR